MNSSSDLSCFCFVFSLIAALNYENVMDTGSETEDEDKLLVSEEDGLLNGVGSPASLNNHDAGSPRVGHTLMTKEDEDDDMRDSGVDHVWHDNDMLHASVDGTGERHTGPKCFPIDLGFHEMIG